MTRPKLLLVAVLAVGIACLDDPNRPAMQPNAQISDGAHSGGNAGFFFLPPMVPRPTITAPFNAFLQPLVRICRWASGCVSAPIDYTLTTAPGSEVIRVSATDKQYQVNWHTDRFNVQPGEDYRIQVFADRDGHVLLGFADVEIAATGKEAKNLSTMQTIGLVDGRTLPIKFFAGIGALRECDPDGPTCAEAVVPPEGGLVVAVNADGEAEAFADFPTDWTDEPTTVMIERIDDRPFKTPFTGPLGAPAGVRQWPLFYEFTTNREGLRFAKRVRIGVCNVEDPFSDPFHPEDRSHLSLAIGGTANDFRTLPFAAVDDVLALCRGVTRLTTASLPGSSWQALFARAAALATSVVLPRPLHARTIAVVDGGAGGSTDSFESPVGTVDLAPAPDLFIPTGSPTVTPSTVAPGGTVQLSAWTIKNRGNVDLNSPTGSVRNGFYLSADTVITAGDVFLTDNFNTNGVLQLGEQFDWGGPTLTIPAGTAPGTYYVGILVDDTGLIPEFDETNNYVSVPITVAGTVVSVDVNDFAIDLSAGRMQNPSGVSGSGFFKDTQVIFGAGFAYGTSATDILLGYDSRNQDSDFDPTEVVVVSIGSSETPHHTTAEVRPGGDRAGIPGVTVTQESFAFSNAEDAGYVLLKYTLTNTNAGPVSNVFAGFVADPDLLFSENPADDRAAFNHELSVAEVAEDSQETYPQVIGIVPITSMETGLNYFAWRNGGSPSDPTTREGWFEFLSLSASGVTVSVGPADVRFLTGVGPFEIPAEASRVVWFALVGGNNRAAFDANVAAAVRKAGGL